MAEEIRAAGGEAALNGDDISDWDQAGHLVEQTIETFGHLDTVVCNAGIVRDSARQSTTAGGVRSGPPARRPGGDHRVGRGLVTEEAFADMMPKPEGGFDAMDPANVSPIEAQRDTVVELVPRVPSRFLTPVRVRCSVSSPRSFVSASCDRTAKVPAPSEGQERVDVKSEGDLEAAVGDAEAERVDEQQREDHH